MLLKKGVIVFNQQALEKVRYDFFHGLAPTSDKSLSLWKKVHDLKHEPNLLQEKKESIRNTYFFFRWFYWIFDINRYRENNYILTAYVSYEAYQKISHMTNDEYYILTTDINLDIDMEIHMDQLLLQRRFRLPVREKENISESLGTDTPPRNVWFGNGLQGFFGALTSILPTDWAFGLFRNSDNNEFDSHNIGLELTPSTSQVLVCSSLPLSSYKRIKKALPQREDTYLVNEYIAHRLPIFDLYYQEGEYFSLSELKIAWKRKLLKVHPDKGGDRATEGNFLVRHYNDAYKYILAEIDPSETEDEQEKRRREAIICQDLEAKDEMRNIEKTQVALRTVLNSQQAQLNALQANLAELQNTFITDEQSFGVR